MRPFLLVFLALFSLTMVGCRTAATSTPAASSSTPSAGQHEEAENLLQQANFKRGESKHEEAQALYAQAQEADPQFAQAFYEQACNYALWNKQNEAIVALNKSVELGFNDAARLDAEIALDTLRELKDFPKLQPLILVVRPETEDAKTPAIIFLHGWGDTHYSYAEELEKWADVGWVAVAVRAPDALDKGGYRWPVDDLEATKSYLDSQLKSVDRKTTFLAGFSQGASYSVQLALAYPDEFRGAVAIAPGAWKPKEGEIKFTSEAPQPLFLILGQKDHPKNVQAAKAIESAWVQQSWPVEVVAHEKGHAFPDDWEEQRTRVAEFLLINR